MRTKKFTLVIHGGADGVTPFLRNNIEGSEKGMIKALKRGYEILKRGGSALDAVEMTVRVLEDDPLFNAGRGSALNSRGEVEMDAAIMDGKTLKAGAVSIVRGVKNPVTLARTVMTKTKHVFLSGYGALELANSYEAEIMPKNYFVTPHKYEDYLHSLKQSKRKQEKQKEQKEQKKQKKREKQYQGTVGAVAVDHNGNLAAATSTGGTNFRLPGRIGDTCVIGAGCYADNHACAVSGTGEGEFLITNVVAHTIAMLVEVKKYSLQRACDYVIHRRHKFHFGEMGVIAVDAKRHIAISYNTPIMRRGWVTSDGKFSVKIYS